MIPLPDLQITFSVSLAEIRRLYLQDALRDTVRSLEIKKIDEQLATNAASHSLAVLAGFSLRGETLFPVPYVLEANPRLLGYYRLLYGYSQKEFYTAETGATAFKSMEERGSIRETVRGTLPAFCKEMCAAGAHLLAGIAGQPVTAAFLHDLTILTLGPQLRGGANVRRGEAGIIQVFNAIKDIVAPNIVSADTRRIEVRNAAGRTVLIEFAADPDIVIREEIRRDTYRNIIAIEVKAGRDYSNIHNRIGEAEKSHQKARSAKYVECWTIVNVDRLDMAMAAKESPSTNKFFKISDIVLAGGNDYTEFKDHIKALTGI